MIKLIAQRFGLGIVTLWIVTILIFAGTEILPGDVASALLGQNRTPEALEAIRQQLGLERPAIVRYSEWLADFVAGDMGKSMVNGREISNEIGPRLGNTIFLASMAALIAVPLAIGLGVVSAIRPQGSVDKIVSLVALVSVSLPEFFIGYILIMLLSVKVDWLPSLAMISPGMGIADRLYATALPILTLVLVVIAHMMRMTRAAIMAILSSAYIEMAVLKGVSPWKIVVYHALPNALAPIINVVGVSIAYLIVGVVVVEVVFVYPGMGQLMVDAVYTRDLPVVQACGLIFGSAYVLLNILVDVLCIMSNPRIRYSR